MARCSGPMDRQAQARPRHRHQPQRQPAELRSQRYRQVRVSPRIGRNGIRIGLLTLTAIIAMLAGFLVYDHQQARRPSDGNQHPSRTPVQSQTVLPFTGLSGPEGLTVDSAGDVYVADGANNRVVKIAPESGAQQVLPFTDLNKPFAVAVDS